MPDGAFPGGSRRREDGTLVAPHREVVPGDEAGGHEQPERGTDPFHQAAAREVAQEVLEHPEPDDQQGDDGNHGAEAEHHNQVNPAGVQPVLRNRRRRRGSTAAVRSSGFQVSHQTGPPTRSELMPPSRSVRAPEPGKRGGRHGEGGVDDHADPGGSGNQGDAGGHQPAPLPEGLRTSARQPAVVDPDE